MGFENIVGNENVKQLLNKNINSNNILHSYLFLGIEGIGKKLFAKEFAKMILCKEDNNKPCNTCKSCIEFDNNNNPDYMVINRDYDKDKKKEKSLIGIEQIRYLNSKITEKPIVSNRKVYIINDSDLMTREAQNCLLKTLEEPPEYASIILIASNESKLLNTIKSRCLKVNFNKIGNEDIKNYLNANTDKSIDDKIIPFFDGSIGKALKILDNLEDYNKIEEIVNNLDKYELIYIMNNADILYKNKDLIYDYLEYINILLFNSKQIKKINCVRHVEEAKKRLNSNSNYDMTIDNLLMKIWEEVNN